MRRRSLPTLLLCASLLAPALAAEPLKLVTGEYAPFTGERLPEGGPLTAIARRAFAAAGTEVAIRFLPWKRGYSETLEGRHDASFPYGRNAERERDFYFSESYYTVDRRMYYLAKAGLKPEDSATLKGRTYCLPLGFMPPKSLEGLIANKALEVQSPADLASCAKLLQRGRVDFFTATPDIAEAAIAQAGLPGGLVTSTSIGKSENFLIVPKTHPRAQEILSSFNKGLAVLRSKGELERILKDAGL